jgi:hypothetical protein
MINLHSRENKTTPVQNYQDAFLKMGSQVEGKLKGTTSCFNFVGCFRAGWGLMVKVNSTLF